MTREELSRAFFLAKNRHTEEPTDLSIFDGFGLQDFEKVNVTIDSVAALINWQCLQFNGQYDPVALNEVAEHGRKKFIVIDS
jgi:hypothetical protein